MKIRTRYILILINLVIVLILFFRVEIFDIKYNKRMAGMIREITYMTDQFNWSSMEESERKSKYQKMMIRILENYAYQYSEKYKKAMIKEQKINYINLNYQAARELDFGLFDVPIIHQMESSFNPYAKGQYEEFGMAQMKYWTAVFCQASLKYMPDNARRILSFEIKNPEDLYDPIIAVKCTYVYLFWLRREFKGREDWYISGYRWGGYLSRHWFGGDGFMPISFTLDGIKYDVLPYYMNFRKWKDAYESGKLEIGIPIDEQWQAYYKSLVQDEINFRNTMSLIRRLRKELNQKRDIEKELKIKYNDIEKMIQEANEELRILSGEAKKKGFTAKFKEDFKKTINKMKEVIRPGKAKEIKKDDKKN